MVMQGKGCIPFYFNKKPKTNHELQIQLQSYNAWDPLHTCSAIHLVCIGAHKKESKEQVASILLWSIQTKTAVPKTSVRALLRIMVGISLYSLLFWFVFEYLKRMSFQVRWANPGVSFLLLYPFVLPFISQKPKITTKTLKNKKPKCCYLCKIWEWQYILLEPKWYT